MQQWKLCGSPVWNGRSIYHPETERICHYFRTSLPLLFDGVLHFDETRAAEPLERNVEWEKGEVPETFQFGVKV